MTITKKERGLIDRIRRSVAATYKPRSERIHTGADVGDCRFPPFFPLRLLDRAAPTITQALFKKLPF
ncbi:MAG: hypothetical protein CM1200mP41_30670 [Gammaproteobacteria bacterium]|nr:MAG: hypothetical protein CM1200mP41_30670 [Gammaproteobacteria bacterium]